jgi:hypothetical protein
VHFLFEGIRYFVNFISVVVLIYIMLSPKLPLKLPGKKAPIKQDMYNLEYMFNHETNENDNDAFKSRGDDEEVLYSAAREATLTSK